METKDDKKELPQYLFEEHYKSQASHLARLSEKTLLVERNLYSIFLATSTSTLAILISLHKFPSDNSICRWVYLLALLLLLLLLSAVLCSILLYENKSLIFHRQKVFARELVCAIEEHRYVHPRGFDSPAWVEKTEKILLIVYFSSYVILFVYAVLSSFDY